MDYRNSFDLVTIGLAFMEVGTEEAINLVLIMDSTYPTSLTYTAFPVLAITTFAPKAICFS